VLYRITVRRGELLFEILRKVIGLETDDY